MSRRLALTTATAGTLLVLAATHAGAEQGGRNLSDLRDATADYSSLAAAQADGFAIVEDLAEVTCIDHDELGGMGTHYALFSRVGDGEISMLEPEILLYDETVSPARFLGVEYLVLAADWHATHGKQPPKLFGKKFTLVPAGNRYGLPDFYEQHVWTGEKNVTGLLTDYNPAVTC